MESAVAHQAVNTYIYSMNFAKWAIIAAWLALLSPHAAGAQTLEGNRYVKARITADRTGILPSGDEDRPSATLGIVLEVAPGWHVYWRNSGESGSPPDVKWTLPAGWRAGELIWPAPLRILERGGITTFGYNSDITLAAPLFTPAVIPDETETFEVAARVRWLVCADICVPGEATVATAFQFGTDVPLEPSDDLKRIEQTLAEAPRTAAAAAQEFPDLKGFAVSSRQLPAASGQEVALQLSLEGLSGSAELAKHLQLFPFAAKHFDFRRPLLLEREASPSVLLQARVLSGTPLKRQPVGGVLVIAPELSGASFPVSIEWGGAIDPAFPPAAASAAVELEAGLTPLSYRIYRAAADETNEAAKPADFSWRSFLIAALSGLLAGVILNLMPCVLPIISIKVMSFINAGSRGADAARRSAYAFSAGILFSFLTLAGIVISLRSLGTHVGWGFQFQHPAVVFLMFIVVFVLSLVFFDVYTFQIPYLNSANKAVSRMESSLLSHFFEGILVTALSTPCTAPFLGTALAFAFVQPAAITIAVFLSIGAGLSLPYAFFATHPALLKRLPRPGPWEYRLKEFLGFLLLATAIWLLFILDRLAADAAVWAVAAAVFIFFCLWAVKNVDDLASRTATRAALKLLLFALFCGVMWRLWPLATEPGERVERADSISNIKWQEYSAAAVEQARRAGQTVFIDFTADWCVTCKANEALVIETDEIGRFIDEHDVVALKADWTSGDAEVTEALNSYGGQGVPLYVVLSADRSAPPQVLPTLLTRSILLSALEEALQQPPAGVSP